MALAWSIVESLDTAAAFRALGIKVQSDKGTDTARGNQWHRWSVCNDGNLPGTQSPAMPLIQAVRKNELEKIDPAHPILDFLGVLKIRHQINDALHQGTHYRIDIPQSVYGAVLVPGDEPHAVLMPPHCKTGDLKLAACLIRLGLPLAQIVGSPPSSQLWLATPGYELHGSAPVAAQIVPRFRALGRDSWAHPAPLPPLPVSDPDSETKNQEPRTLNRLCSLMHVLWVRDQLHNYINNREQNLIITNPFNKRGVLMPENTPGPMIDRCRKFMHIP